MTQGVMEYVYLKINQAFLIRGMFLINGSQCKAILNCLKLWIVVSIYFMMLMVTASENLIVNGKFTADQMPFPPFWDCKGGKVKYIPNSGPNGRNVIEIQNNSTIRQSGLRVVPGEKYLFSGWFRTSCSKPGKGSVGLKVIDGYWHKSVSMKTIPKNTNGKWVFIKEKLTMFNSTEGYTVVVYPGKKGTLEVADPQIIPLSQNAKKHSRSALQSGPGRLVPICFMDRINLDKPELSMVWSGEYPADFQDLVCVYQYGNSEKKLDFTTDSMILPLTGIGLGRQKLKISLVNRKTGEISLHKKFHITVLQYPQKN